MTDKKYWHELSNFEQGRTTISTMDDYIKPNWCELDSALSVHNPCKRLLRGSIHDIEDCKGCGYGAYMC